MRLLKLIKRLRMLKNIKNIKADVWVIKDFFLLLPPIKNIRDFRYIKNAQEYKKFYNFQ